MYSILVVDDDLKNRELFEMFLGDFGYNVKTAADGQSALDILKSENNFLVAFIDIIMPQMNGVELCSKIREIGFKGFICAVSGERGLFEISESGFDDYILKPVDFDDILRIIDIAIKKVSF